MLNKEQILDSNDIKTQVVDIPEWDGQVTIKMLSALEKDTLENLIYPMNKTKKPIDNIRAAWCAFSIVDEKGKKLFSIVEIDALGQKSAAALDRIFTAALSLNKVTAKDIDGLAKNSETTQAEDFNSN